MNNVFNALPAWLMWVTVTVAVLWSLHLFAALYLRRAERRTRHRNN